MEFTPLNRRGLDEDSNKDGVANNGNICVLPRVIGKRNFVFFISHECY